MNHEHCDGSFCLVQGCPRIHTIQGGSVDFEGPYDAPEVAWHFREPMQNLRLGRCTVIYLDKYDLRDIPPAECYMDFKPYPHHTFNVEWTWRRDDWSGEWNRFCGKVEAVSRYARAQ